MANAHESSSVRSEAVFSPCRQYRYWLCREWGIAAPFGVFLLHNPSVAGAFWIDPTLAKCNNLAVQWGWRGFGVVNLWPNVSSRINPRITIPSAITAENAVWLTRARKLADIFVIGTGSRVSKRAVAALIRHLQLPGPFHAIDTNNGGTFLHPARVEETKYTAPVLVTVP
jgi:hypothetical protein